MRPFRSFLSLITVRVSLENKAYAPMLLMENMVYCIVIQQVR